MQLWPATIARLSPQGVWAWLKGETGSPATQHNAELGKSKFYASLQKRAAMAAHHGYLWPLYRPRLILGKVYKNNG